MNRIKMTIEYDGTNYHGFQRQKNAHTIQAEIEDQIKHITGEEVTVSGAGRTDARVHAKGQVIAFTTESPIPDYRWKYALNSFLPYDIRVLQSKAVEESFHPAFDAINKRYNYRIYRASEGAVFYRNYALINTEHLDINEMNIACGYIIGYHDFRAFCSSGATSKTFDRTVNSCFIEETINEMILNIEANGFLYNMVRIIMGTLLEVGRGRLKSSQIPEIIASSKRSLAGPTAPPQGLYLMEVQY